MLDSSFKNINEISNENEIRIKKTHPRAKFTQNEDELLKRLVENFGINDWQTISRQMPERNARQCRDRWQNYLSPEVVNGPWTYEEEELLVKKYEELGPSWKQIATFFPTRTDINIKSRWHLRERRLKKEDLQMKKAFLRQQPSNKRICPIRQTFPISHIQNRIIPSVSYHLNMIQNSLINPISQIQFASQFIQPHQIHNNQLPHQQFRDQQIIINKPKTVETKKIEYSSNPTSIGDSFPSINTDPLPFISSNNTNDDKNDNEISFLTDDSFDSTQNDCWNSLLMNEDNASYENVFDSWF